MNRSRYTPPGVGSTGDAGADRTRTGRKTSTPVNDNMPHEEAADFNRSRISEKAERGAAHCDFVWFEKHPDRNYRLRLLRQGEAGSGSGDLGFVLVARMEGRNRRHIVWSKGERFGLTPFGLRKIKAWASSLDDRAILDAWGIENFDLFTTGLQPQASEIIIKRAKEKSS